MSQKPVRYFNGELRLSMSDLASNNFGVSWGHTRSFSNVGAGFGSRVNGNGWLVEQIPQLSADASGNAMVTLGKTAYAFQASGADAFKAMFAFQAQLGSKGSGSARIYRLLTGKSGTALTFDAGGRFRSVVNAVGDEMLVLYDTVGRLALLTLSPAGTTGASASYTYTYTGTTATDQLASVLYQVNGQGVRQALYTYYGTGDARGNYGDLATVTVQGYDASAGTWFTIHQSAYRYYTTGLPYLKYVVGPQAYANLVAAGLDPATAADSQLAGYADYFFVYDSYGRVVQEATDGGAYAYGFSYAPSGMTPGTNVWSMRTTETLPDGGQNVVYTNSVGLVLLRVFVAAGTGQKWCTAFHYNAQGVCVLMAEPSAVASYSESSPSLATLNAGAGLVRTYVYGDPDGYFTAEAVQAGSGGAPVQVRALAYTSQTVGTSGQFVKVLASETLFQSDAGGGSVPATTSHAYTWQPSSTGPGSSYQVAQTTTTLPTISTAQNGSGVATTRVANYDAFGNESSTVDERGFTTSSIHDTATGALLQHTDELGGVSDFQSDGLGRTTRMLGPTHTIDLSGAATAIRRAVWTVYRDDLSQVWTGTGCVRADGSAPVLINPVSIAGLDKAGRTVDQVQAARGGGVSSAGALSAADTFPPSSWSRWTHHAYDVHDRLAATRVYFLIPASGAGTSGVNYNESVFGYDASGRQNRQVTPGGTVTRTVFHPRGWPLQSWVGTNDTGATGQDPSGGGAGGNNMVVVRASQYDGGAVGDGNLTRTTLYQDAATTRVTLYGYDFRDRRISTTAPAGATEAYTFDNQDRVLQTDRHDPSSGVLVGRSATKYDLQGRVYQTSSYAVDPGTGTVGNALVSRMWFDPSGNVVKSQDAGSSLFAKTVYDGLGRATLVYRAYNLTATGYPYPVNASADTVIEQVETSYDAASNVIAQTMRERDHDASGTGPLTTAAGAQPQARVSYQGTWPDPLGRPVATANYGTNAAAAWTRPDVIPAASDTVLVTLIAYDLAGNNNQTTDPLGAVSQSAFDQAGRLTQTLANYVSGAPRLTRTRRLITPTTPTTGWPRSQQKTASRATRSQSLFMARR